MLRKTGRFAATIALVGCGLAVWTSPAAAAPPAGVCPAHPAQFPGKTVRLTGDGSDDELLCANLKGATLNGLDLGQFNMQYADLTGASLMAANLTQTDLTGAKLDNATFQGADLTQATLVDVTATGTSFVGAKLGQATITGATLTQANFTGADLTQADLSHSDLTGATLTGADLDEATLTGTTMKNTVGKPKSADFTGISTGVSAATIAGWVSTASVVLCVLFVVPIIIGSRRRARRTRRAYARPSMFVAGLGIPGMGTTGTGVPGTGVPGMGSQPGFATPQAPVTTPTFAVPGAAVPQPRTVAEPDLSTFMQGETPAPYTPTVPEFPAWQPMSTSASMTEASHVVEEDKPKRWFRKS